MKITMDSNSHEKAKWVLENNFKQSTGYEFLKESIDLTYYNGRLESNMPDPAKLSYDYIMRVEETDLPPFVRETPKAKLMMAKFREILAKRTTQPLISDNMRKETQNLMGLIQSTFSSISSIN
jgi:hypothetical protein